ncbi:MAG: hypothetical protein LBJ64_00685 [Deltaproteobacteria bacterium]|nr:hypothetical protein [Deltaproteobacteria bacterium]
MAAKEQDFRVTVFFHFADALSLRKKLDFRLKKLLSCQLLKKSGLAVPASGFQFEAAKKDRTKPRTNYCSINDSAADPLESADYYRPSGHVFTISFFEFLRLVPPGRSPSISCAETWRPFGPAQKKTEVPPSPSRRNNL